MIFAILEVSMTPTTSKHDIFLLYLFFGYSTAIY